MGNFVDQGHEESLRMQVAVDRDPVAQGLDRRPVIPHFAVTFPGYGQGHRVMTDPGRDQFQSTFRKEIKQDLSVTGIHNIQDKSYYDPEPLSIWDNRIFFLWACDSACKAACSKRRRPEIRIPERSVYNRIGVWIEAL